MATSPPASPVHPPRPMSAIARAAPRSASRMSLGSKPGNGSRASDDESHTAVRVAVRVRPPLTPTDPGFDLIPQRFQRSMIHTTTDTSLTIDSPQGRKLFVFDRVFGPEVMQDGIWDYLADSISAFTQGYNVSLLAYGQSGAGKSYTMGTSEPNEQQDANMMGVIPRAATALFEKLDTPRGSYPNRASGSMSHLRAPRGYGQQNALGDDRNWSLKATYVEIYNEQLRDLLISDSTPPHERGNVAIREDTKGNIILTGLRQVEICSVSDLMNALTFGSSIRQTDATAINAKSSRSHAVFSLNLVQRRNKVQQTPGLEKRFSVPIEAMTGHDVSVTTDSKLHFVDLAGSERLKNTGAQGERAKEGISINAGLASLGKVISQLSSRQAGSHVSYRDSKLTRLLQDSLGGNAITYMIACVTPAEFHLSETLNTVQYAQRARAIQSKPRIQQVDDGDKQALIERLRAEVNFLREQIRSSAARGTSPRRSGPPATHERPDRQNEREVELQNQLLDSQENYNALGQRHAKLIAELAKAREHESAENGMVEDALGDSATDRLNRSNSFAQAVEQVVLEYEKTIQSLEQSLSKTRASLSNTEASLLERETKCAYAETINTQLQSRLQKLMDREASTENYLHDLEVKLDGHTSGEEKNATIILELRKEIARVRESEASCEDYISTLEERLAEADQDTELMQREIDRLEQVIERQRSLGKLDTLLQELDHIDGDDQGGRVRGSVVPSALNLHPIDESDALLRQRQMQGSGSDADETAHDMQGRSMMGTAHTADGHLAVANGQAAMVPSNSHETAKLETVTQELLDLRFEHETTLNDYDQLHAKYEEALRYLAELKDTTDEARHQTGAQSPGLSTESESQTRPESLVSEKSLEPKSGGPRSSISRSLSSELSSAILSPATAVTSHADATSEDETATAKPGVSSGDNQKRTLDDPLDNEVKRLRALAKEREAAEKELTNKYAELESKHNETLDMVEELKTEVSKARASEATSPRTSTPIIRRKSSQNVMGTDRAHRCFTSLRNIANSNFEEQSDAMQSFEVNLNAAMHELHSRSERIQELEADVASARKEMETKMTIISGLTRERSSLKAGPVDMSMVATLRDQLEASEKQLFQLSEAHALREQELTGEIESLRASMATTSSREAVTGDQNGEGTETMSRDVSKLQYDLAGWEHKHQAVLDSMHAAEGKHRQEIERLQADVEKLNAKLGESPTEVKDKAADNMSQDLVNSLRGELEKYKTLVSSHSTKLAQLEAAHKAVTAELDNATKARDASMDSVAHHEEHITSLKEQISGFDAIVSAHAENMARLRSAHAEQMAEIKAQEQKTYENQVEVLMSEHSDAIRKLEAELSEAENRFADIAQQVSVALGCHVGTEMLEKSIESLTTAKTSLEEEQKNVSELQQRIGQLSSTNESLEHELEAAKTAIGELLVNDKHTTSAGSVVDKVSAVKNRLSDLETKNKKHSRLVEELEEQLQTNFDEVQMTNNRLSSLQSERNVQLEEATAARAKLQAELDSIKEEYAAFQTRHQEMNASGMNRANSSSTIRKSPSHATLPSPPPVIPLPPLPNIARSGSPPVPASPGSGRAGGRDLDSRTSQHGEDHEARIQTIERHLRAERQLTRTLEEALNELEDQSKKLKAECELWRKKASDLEVEVKELKERPIPEPAQDNRWSLQAVEEERKKRQTAEAARKQLEERMAQINKGKKKKGSLNCF
ncbi:hypothetical protein CDD82_3938 [Ophiocordyceps australis]|uniref:Kinesin motor domain-containing protein n=1 Tax=Ophiocordyceps australis TaxID=1399860 RepID=A0A2C5ZAY8_9HYPO|nr:hypothetical protein CDD82_3938 [Ophiocordyceps australis]